ncbi:MAG: AAA family ATPase [Gammaproteobacteria bacterium]|nr:AAA family ATPase [Gammaproteobacteria bacterium]
MKIAHIDIRNFRKLKSCRVELAEGKTIFVGANNSGKTSAMDALIMFLKKSKRKELSTTDFTLSNWAAINKIGNSWVAAIDEQAPDFSLEIWRPHLPSIDVWLQVDDAQIHYVSHILPTLDWTGGLLGVRLALEPKKPEELYKRFISAFESAKATMSSRPVSGGKGLASTLKLWPQSMRDFLDREMQTFFSVNAFILDPSKVNQPNAQDIADDVEPLEGDPFDGLFKIDIINAQRGFSDPNSGEGISNADRRLSSQLRQYFDNHLDPAELPDITDLDALEAMEAARSAFDVRLKASFSSAIGELEGLNYPGFSDPQILLSSKMNPLESLNHDSAVQFKVTRNDAPESDALCLPEKYNGLGYQNLISMIFSLIRFRDEWMRIGKAGKREADDSRPIQPLHLMLIEEPEAHLHAQVQQVFIKKAFGVLRSHSDLGNNKQFVTQMVVSTHSSHIAHETDFASLRYFRRQNPSRPGDVPYATVVNMTNTFGGNSDTARFATRYLKTTHCDLFFADAVILVEGPAERMLVPHFIRCQYPDLDRSYISLLEIGGSHAHRLCPLIDALGLLTLVITDLDSIAADTSSKVLPVKGQGFRTGNDTLKSWIPVETMLDELLKASSESKVARCGRVRVTYPCEVALNYQGSEGKAIPYTFEDALVLGNLGLFKIKTGTAGLLKKMVDAVNLGTLSEACEAMFEALKSGRKAEMALELLYTTEPSTLQTPQYITEGLDWLKAKLAANELEQIYTPATVEAE